MEQSIISSSIMNLEHLKLYGVPRTHYAFQLVLRGTYPAQKFLNKRVSKCLHR